MVPFQLIARSVLTLSCSIFTARTSRYIFSRLYFVWSVILANFRHSFGIQLPDTEANVNIIMDIILDIIVLNSNIFRYLLLAEI